MLTPEQCVGAIDPSTLPATPLVEETEEEIRIRKAKATKLPLNVMINIDDFEVGRCFVVQKVSL